MEGNSIINDSYKQVEKILKDNSTGRVTIDYSKLDERTAATIRLTLNKVLLQRKGELWQVMSGAK
jgi:hypothetical protein